MSHTTLHAIKSDGSLIDYAEFRNSHGGAAAVWNILCEKYGISSKMPYRCWSCDHNPDRKKPSGFAAWEALWTWAEAHKDALPPWELVTLMTTADYVIVRTASLAVVADHMERFHAAWRLIKDEAGHVFHVGDQAAELRQVAIDAQTEGYLGVCWTQTSVCADMWLGPYNEKADEHTPYNVFTAADDRQWYLDDEIDLSTKE